jgi:hypothetical protein
MSVVWKDCQMAGFLVLGISFLLDERRWLRLVGVFLLFLATAMRDNAPAATLPLLALLFARRDGQRWWVRLAVAIAIWIAITAAAMTTNKLLTRVQHHAWYTSTGPADIIGVLEYSRRYSDAELRQILEGAPVIPTDDLFVHARTIYDPSTWWWYLNGDARMFNWPVTQAERDAIARAWRKLVFDNPLSYLRHHVASFRRVIALTKRPPFDAVWRGKIDLSAEGYPPLYADDTGVQATIGDGLLWLANKTVLFRPYAYLVLALAFFPLTLRRHRDVLALFAAGIVYELALFPFASTPDYRYSHWMVTCTIIATVILFTRRRKAQPVEVVSPAV